MSRYRSGKISPLGARIKDRLASWDNSRSDTGTDSSSGLLARMEVLVAGPLQAHRHAEAATRRTAESRKIEGNVIAQSYIPFSILNCRIEFLRRLLSMPRGLSFVSVALIVIRENVV